MVMGIESLFVQGIYIYIYIYIYRHTHIHIYVHIYIYMYMYAKGLKSWRFHMNSCAPKVPIIIPKP